jgi:hypothetical protein
VQSDRIRDRMFSEFLGEAKVKSTLTWLAETGCWLVLEREALEHVPEHRNVVIHDSPATRLLTRVLITVFSPFLQGTLVTT